MHRQKKMNLDIIQKFLNYSQKLIQNIDWNVKCSTIKLQEKKEKIYLTLNLVLNFLN